MGWAGLGWAELSRASCPTSQPEVNHVPLEGPVLEAPGRSLFGLSGVLTAGSSRCLHSHAESLRVRGPEGDLRGQGGQQPFRAGTLVGDRRAVSLPEGRWVWGLVPGTT